MSWRSLLAIVIIRFFSSICQYQTDSMYCYDSFGVYLGLVIAREKPAKLVKPR